MSWDGMTCPQGPECPAAGARASLQVAFQPQQALLQPGARELYFLRGEERESSLLLVIPQAADTVPGSRVSGADHEVI